MALLLDEGETVFFPQPYLPGEPAELVITNRRMVRVSDAGMAEFPVKDIDYVGRQSMRPTLAIGVVIGLIGLSLVGVGLYAAIANKGPINGLFAEKKEKLPELPPLPGAAGAAPGAPGAAAPGTPAPPKSDEDEEEEEEEEGIIGQVGGLIMIAGGLLVAVVGYFLAKRQKHIVVARSGAVATELECKDKGEQTMILQTLTSSVNGSKAQAAAEAKAAAAQAQAMAAAGLAPGQMGQMGQMGMMPGMQAGMQMGQMGMAGGAAEQVDDGGDPVKALQDLKAQKDAGKIDLATFDRRRAILLQRLQNRK